MPRSLFRSEPMERCQLFLQSEAAFQCIAELGELGRVQFDDLNSEVNAFQRKFVNDVRRCEEMQRLLTYVEKEIIREDFVKLEPEDPSVETPLPKDMIDMETMFQKIEEELRQVNDNVDEMTRNYVQLAELKHVLRSVDEFFESRHGQEEAAVFPGGVQEIDPSGAGVPQEDPKSASESEAGSSKGEGSENGSVLKKGAQAEQENLGFFAGTIPVTRFQAFERLLWRVGRGIIFCHQIFIDEPMTDVDGNSVRKSVFIVFFPGEQLKQRVRKICDAFHANIYPCPASAEGRREAAIGVLQRIEDMKHVFNGSRDHRMKVLANAARNIRSWRVQLSKMKAVFHIMNMLNVDVTQKCLIGECWIPEHDMVKVQAALRRGTEAAGSSFPCIINRIETRACPPTFYKTNRFTDGFQAIVNAYGVGSYGELNPAPYAIITFPFLFAVMFGDAGHGVIMAAVALALIAYEGSLSKNRDEIVSTFFGGRYLILLMGIFSIYTGLIYNDVFSKPMNIFGSSWTLKWDGDAVPVFNKSIQVPIDQHTKTYPFGVDPIWALTKNKITFTNSYKMKMAVILGLLQMSFGTFLSLANALYFKDRTKLPPPRSNGERFLRRTLNVWAQFVPEILFLLSLFGYLVFMIFYKWSLPFGNPDYASEDETLRGAGCSRSLLMLFINLFLPPAPNAQCYVSKLYAAAPFVEKIILIVALLAVPWLLLAKPLYLMYLNKLHSTPLPPDFVPIVAEEERNENAEDSASSSSTSSRRKKSTVSMHTLKAGNGLHNVDLDERSVQDVDPEEEREPFDLGDVFIHQIIHTIEYCLGAVSNTASYLRLWALSLAHAQLSEVLWSMLFASSLFGDPGTGEIVNTIMSSVKIFLFWFPWAFLTLAILLVMEGLSAFLHALRLHWVEFMNKFFSGEGYLFTPFDFREVTYTLDE
ncbi:V-type proton ATPase 116 kDa subunit a [Galendromus occidentalis]|uniref:V-type proton ATPase subunit a n=1 Tax=Galendromus occidentalis TaxID=34638 RepID=A0AAJ6QUH7_9ACAR|nr:V-type proton ATPase 116 kDa subunit a [Galendromus occidentalis]